jgi:hypothetical protein
LLPRERHKVSFFWLDASKLAAKWSGKKMFDPSKAVPPLEKKIKAHLFLQQNLRPLIPQAKNLKERKKNQEGIEIRSV